MHVDFKKELNVRCFYLPWGQSRGIWALSGFDRAKHWKSCPL